MKNKILLAVMAFYSFTINAQQLNLNFEQAEDFDLVYNSFMKMSEGTFVENFNKDAVNKSNKAFEFNYAYGGEVWDYVGFTFVKKHKNFKLDAVNGKIFKMKFLSKRVPAFSITLRIWDGEEKLDVVKKVQNIKLNTWNEIEFDFSAFPDCNFTRIDSWFQDGSKPDGDIYLIDDLIQTTTISEKK